MQEVGLGLGAAGQLPLPSESVPGKGGRLAP